MYRTAVVIIGAGQAGLAMSYCLSALGIEHVVLERGAVGERWRASSWDSLRLLTPNWMTRLPGLRYEGDDPDGFMRVPELVALLERYARSVDAPLRTRTTVQLVAAADGGFKVATTRGTWHAAVVVVATGFCDLPFVPATSRDVAPSISQVLPSTYRNPAQLPDGGVLVVGASSTGIQLADEIHASGRPVTLAVGRHLRLPRTYRGRDILWWLDRLGVLSQDVDSVADLAASRSQPSLQLVGRTDRQSLDVGALHARGVRITGRLVAIDGTRARFDDDLVATCSAADIKLADIRTRIDRFIAGTGTAATDPEPFEPTWTIAGAAPSELDLAAEGIKTIVWAAGYRRSYPWLHVPVLDAQGEIQHHGGITPQPGLYVLGLNFQRRRNSSFIDGVGADAAYLAEDIARYLGSSPGTSGTTTSTRATGSARAKGGTRESGARAGYDAVIVGGRCAGAATALLMARGGMRVLVVDRGAYGTDTLSTHALMRGAVFQLQQWGVLPAIVAAGTPPVRVTTFAYPSQEIVVAIEPRFGVDALYAPRRLLLDRLLVDAAVTAGAEFQYGAAFRDIRTDARGRVNGVSITVDGVPRTIDTALVVGADGARSSVAARLGASRRVHGRHAAGNLYSYWEGVQAAGYEWQYSAGASTGVIPTNDGRACVFVSFPASRFAEEVRGGAAAAYHRLLAETSPSLAARLLDARCVERVHGFAGIPGVLRTPAGPGWALVGDAGYFKDPLTAHGITDALRDAALLARAALAGTDSAIAQYAATRDDLSRRLFEITDRIASFAWSETELQALHRALSKEMSREVRALAEMAADSTEEPCLTPSGSAPRGA